MTISRQHQYFELPDRPLLVRVARRRGSGLMFICETQQGAPHTRRAAQGDSSRVAASFISVSTGGFPAYVTNTGSCKSPGRMRRASGARQPTRAIPGREVAQVSNAVNASPCGGVPVLCRAVSCFGCLNGASASQDTRLALTASEDASSYQTALDKPPYHQRTAGGRLSPSAICWYIGRITPLPRLPTSKSIDM